MRSRPCCRLVAVVTRFPVCALASRSVPGIERAKRLLHSGHRAAVAEVQTSCDPADLSGKHVLVDERQLRHE